MATGTKPAELRELSDPELVERLRETKGELFNLRVQAATGQLDNNRRLQVVRRDIARIYTVIRERELGLSAAPAEFAAALEEAEAAAAAGGDTAGVDTAGGDNMAGAAGDAAGGEQSGPDEAAQRPAGNATATSGKETP
jgi:large subunit ribosomal protein L29